VSGDELVAVVEILSPGNKSSQRAFQQLLEKARHFSTIESTCSLSIPFLPHRTIRKAFTQQSGPIDRLVDSTSIRKSR
jgi:hypothetical protein